MVWGFAVIVSLASGSVCDVEVLATNERSEIVVGKMYLQDPKGLRIIWSTPSNGSNLFRNVPDGEYTLVTAIKNYRGLHQMVEVECGKVTVKRSIRMESGRTHDRYFVLDGDFRQNESGEFEIGRLLGHMRTYFPLPNYRGDCSSDCLVSVDVRIDENGKVVSAKATGFNKAMAYSAEAAAKRSRFFPFVYDGEARKARGTVIYRFPLPPMENL